MGIIGELMCDICIYFPQCVLHDRRDDPSISCHPAGPVQELAHLAELLLVGTPARVYLAAWEDNSQVGTWRTLPSTKNMPLIKDTPVGSAYLKVSNVIRGCSNIT